MRSAAVRAVAVKAQQAMRAQCSTLDTTSGAIESNQSKLGAINAKMRQQLRSMRSSTCYIILMLVVVFVLFFLTFLLMKVAPKPRPR